MVIYNMKLNLKSIFKFLIVLLMVIVVIMIGISVYKIFFNRKTEIPKEYNVGEVNVISSTNFTNVLKEVHDNLNSYVGQKIKFTGFVYRLYDFNDEQFVLAREMIVSSDYQGVVVGFLCNLNGANKYENGAWVEVEGTIKKGEYHGEIPVIEVTNIKATSRPSDEYVYPPDNTYLQTEKNL